jgi:hypothetical protein
VRLHHERAIFYAARSLAETRPSARLLPAEGLTGMTTRKERVLQAFEHMLEPSRCCFRRLRKDESA